METADQKKGKKPKENRKKHNKTSQKQLRKRVSLEAGKIRNSFG